MASYSENPQLNDDPGTIIPFPGETFGLGKSRTFPLLQTALEVNDLVTGLTIRKGGGDISPLMIDLKSTFN
jgi:hypothetical protein